MTKNRKSKIKKNYRKKGIVWILTMLVFFIITISGVKSYQNPSLYGKWASAETKDEVTFKKDGTVSVDGEKIARYQILSGERMEYHIEDKTFLMYYELEGRNLLWGTQKDKMEVFARK